MILYALIIVYDIDAYYGWKLSISHMSVEQIKCSFFKYYNDILVPGFAIASSVNRMK